MINKVAIEMIVRILQKSTEFIKYVWFADILYIWTLILIFIVLFEESRFNFGRGIISVSVSVFQVDLIKVIGDEKIWCQIKVSFISM